MTQGNFLTCETREGLMDIYIASPETKEKLPVILVFQEAFGVNPHIRSVCDRFAQEGFLAAAPDLFHRFGRRLEIPYGERKEFLPLLAQMSNKDIINDARNTMNFLEDLPTADTSKFSTIGFCIGGFASALVATQLKIEKMISFYGAGMVNPRDGIGLTPFVNEMNKIKGRCLFFFGGMDASIPHSDLQAIEQKLTSGKVPFEVDIFENSDHGFFCDERKSYNQVDASLAWKKSISFLREKLNSKLTQQG